MPEKKSVTFKIAEEKFYNNGKILLQSFGSLESDFRNSLNQSGEVTITIRTPNGQAAYEGINATSLNTLLRELVKDIPGINGETHVENGIFYHSSKEGFDFTIYDKEHNFARLYNYYLGAIGILNGDTKIIEQYKKVKYNKRDWKKRIADVQSKLPANSDLTTEKEQLTIVGEFQFGNWALVYRDLFRLLNADSNPGVDFYIYIAATGKLSQLISDNTVSYNQAISVIDENLSVLKTPTWVIGLDIE